MLPLGDLDKLSVLIGHMLKEAGSLSKLIGLLPFTWSTQHSLQQLAHWMNQRKEARAVDLGQSACLAFTGPLI